MRKVGEVQTSTYLGGQVADIDKSGYGWRFFNPQKTYTYLIFSTLFIESDGVNMGVVFPPIFYNDTVHVTIPESSNVDYLYNQYTVCGANVKAKTKYEYFLTLRPGIGVSGDGRREFRIYEAGPDTNDIDWGVRGFIPGNNSSLGSGRKYKLCYQILELNT